MMRHVWILLFLAWALPAAAAGKTVRDWTVNCDDYSCVAETSGAGGLAMGGQGYRLQMARAAGAAEAWYVKLIAHHVPQPKGVMAASVDGAALGDVAVVPADDGDGVLPTDQVQMEKLFAAMRRGQKIELSFAGGGESFSLSGLAAVMLFADEQQKRVGKPVTVAVIDGALAAATVTGDEAQALKAELLDLRVGRECQWQGETAIDFNAQEYDLGEGYGLVIVQCTLGAYQPSTLVFLRGGDGLELQAFTDYGSDTGWGGTFYLGFAEFDPKTRTLHNYVKFRGIGDCGASADWQWTGYNFRLMAYRYRDCSDEPPADPDGDIPEFPQIYPGK